MRLKGKVAIVTGAASGMGLADARCMAREGAAVVMTDVLDGTAFAGELVAQGLLAVFVRHDVTDPAQWDNVAELALTRFGGIDVLVNNAGISGSGAPDVLALDLFDRLLAINLRGTFLGIRCVVPHMRERGGSIINISSVCSDVGTPGVHLGYHASKGGIRSITKGAAAEFGPQGIRATLVLCIRISGGSGRLPMQPCGARQGAGTRALASRRRGRRCGQCRAVSGVG